MTGAGRGEGPEKREYVAATGESQIEPLESIGGVNARWRVAPPPWG